MFDMHGLSLTDASLFSCAAAPIGAPCNNRSSIKTHGTAATPSHIEQYSPTLSILQSIPLGTEGQQPRINDDREGKTHETRTTPRDTRRNRHAIHFNRRRRCCIPARLAPIKFAGTIQYSHHWVRRRTTGEKNCDCSQRNRSICRQQSEVAGRTGP